MSADGGAGMIDWRVEPEHSGPASGPHVSSHTRRDEERANSLALIVTTSLLFILLASALMVGGHAAIGPLLSRSVRAGEAINTGDVVYTMPDRVFCRHMTFDNGSGAIREGAMARCADRSAGADESQSTWFKWSTR